MADRAFTRWHPDTCDCVLEYHNDDSSLHAVVAACRKHASVPDTFGSVLAHNRLKNAVVTHLTTAHGLDPLSVAVSYDRDAAADNDPVIVTSLSLPPDKRADAIASLALKFGDKIKVR